MPTKRLFPVHVLEPDGTKRHHGVLLYQDNTGVRVFGRASAGVGVPVPGHPTVHLVDTLQGATIVPHGRRWRLVLADGSWLDVRQAPGCRSCGNPLGKYRP